MIGINGAEVEVELISLLGLESGRLEFNHDVVLKARVVEQEVDEELVARDLQPVLTANEGEPHSHQVLRMTVDAVGFATDDVCCSGDSPSLSTMTPCVRDTVVGLIRVEGMGRHMADLKNGDTAATSSRFWTV